MEHSNAVSGSDESEVEIINGKRIILDALNELVLQSGKSSITLTKGTVLINGEYILSSAKGSYKIKGGSIRMN